LTNKKYGARGELGLTTPGKDTFMNVSSDSWQPSDLVLFVTALVTIFLGLVFFLNNIEYSSHSYRKMEDKGHRILGFSCIFDVTWEDKH
jgi:hypothetical protein